MADTAYRAAPLASPAPPTFTAGSRTYYQVAETEYVIQSPKDYLELDTEVREMTLVITGEHLAPWGAHTGDRARVKLGGALQPGHLVAAYGSSPDAAEEPFVAVLSVSLDGHAVLSDASGILCCGGDCEGARIAGPVVKVDPALIRV